jgi:hypothetical protein
MATFNEKPITISTSAGSLTLTYSSEFFVSTERGGTFTRRDANLTLKQGSSEKGGDAVWDHSDVITRVMIAKQLERIADALERMAPAPARTTKKRKQ